MCRLGVAKEISWENDTDILTIEYAHQSIQCSKCHYRTHDINLTKSVHLFNNSLNITTEFNNKQFSPFIKISARKIKSKVLSKAKFLATFSSKFKQKIRFIVIHLRGTDRKCALAKYKDDQLIKKIESFGVFKNNSIIYLMTDLTSASTQVKSLKKRFGDFMFQKSDIELFRHITFKKLGSYLVYATELELQAISDGIVRTYKGHDMPNSKKELGFLETPECAWKPKKTKS